VDERRPVDKGGRWFLARLWMSAKGLSWFIREGYADQLFSLRLLAGPARRGFWNCPGSEFELVDVIPSTPGLPGSTSDSVCAALVNTENPNRT